MSMKPLTEPPGHPPASRRPPENRIGTAAPLKLLILHMEPEAPDVGEEPPHFGRCIYRKTDPEFKALLYHIR
jgi:hypothetical protein